jgi:hypothetical protein
MGLRLGFGFGFASAFAFGLESGTKGLWSKNCYSLVDSLKRYLSEVVGGRVVDAVVAVVVGSASEPVVVVENDKGYWNIVVRIVVPLQDLDASVVEDALPLPSHHIPPRILRNSLHIVVQRRSSTSLFQLVDRILFLRPG